MLSAEQIEKQLRLERFKNAVDVSGALDNCFFHAYALYQLGNHHPFPADLFQENDMDSESVRKLKKLLQEEAVQALLTTAESTEYVFDKTLILGVLLRSWFVHQLSQHVESRDATFKVVGTTLAEHDIRRTTFLQLIHDYTENYKDNLREPAKKAHAIIENVREECQVIDLLLEENEVNNAAKQALKAVQERINPAIEVLYLFESTARNESIEIANELLIGIESEIKKVESFLEEIKVNKEREFSTKKSESSLVAEVYAESDHDEKAQMEAIQALLTQIAKIKKSLQYDLRQEQYHVNSFLEQIQDNSIYKANKAIFNEKILKISESELAGYWMNIGYRQYCKELSQQGVKITYADIDTLFQQYLRYAIYNEQDGSVIVCDSKNPDVELVLGAKAGHYKLLTTEKTNELFKQYTLQSKCYLDNRELYLAEYATSFADSIFIEAILPPGFRSDPVGELVKEVPAFLQKLLPKKEAAVNQVNVSDSQVATVASVGSVENVETITTNSSSPQIIAEVTQVGINNSQIITTPLVGSSVNAETTRHEIEQIPTQISDEGDVDASLVIIDESKLTNTKLRQFNQQLIALDEKAKELASRGPRHQRAAEAANALHGKLSSAFATFLDSAPTKAAFRKFSQTSLKAIERHQGVLEGHRKEGGLFKQVLGNIVLGIVGLGLFYGIALAINRSVTGRYFFFAPETAQKVSKIETMIPEIKVK